MGLGGARADSAFCPIRSGQGKDGATPTSHHRARLKRPIDHGSGIAPNRVAQFERRDWNKLLSANILQPSSDLGSRRRPGGVGNQVFPKSGRPSPRLGRLAASIKAATGFTDWIPKPVRGRSAMIDKTTIAAGFGGIGSEFRRWHHHQVRRQQASWIQSRGQFRIARGGGASLCRKNGIAEYREEPPAPCRS
jgi:hypothetical protein